MHSCRLVFLSAVVAIGGALSAPEAHSQPSNAQLQQAVTGATGERYVFGVRRSDWELARVAKFSVDAMENVGNKVDPQWRARFSATLVLSSATYDGVDRTSDGVWIVRVLRQAGESFKLIGRTTSTLYGGNWRTRVEIENFPTDLGLAAGWFGTRVIVSGTKEELAYRAEQAENQRLAAIAAQRVVEKEREEASQRLLAEISALETTDCTDGELTPPKGSERAFTLSAQRECWTPWIVVPGFHVSWRWNR